MSIFRIGDRNQLENFLRILSEESGQSQSAVLRGRQESMSRSIQDDLTRYEKIEEQEDEPEDEAEDEDDSPTDVQTDDDISDEEDDEEGFEDSAGDESSGEEGEEEYVSPDITFYKVRDKINDIRAAPSLKGKEVKQDMEQWLDRLDENEKQLLYSFLETVDKIMKSQVSGSDAHDPSDEPTSIDVSGPSIEEPEGEKAAAPTDTEDTSPPIRAGGSQELSEIRNRFTSLVSR